MKSPGVWIALAAVLVMTARLVLGFAEGDGLAVPVELRAVLLGTSAVCSAVVLTGGGAYIAHTLAATATHRGVLATVWALMLLAVWILATPIVVSHLTGPLADVLPSPWGPWAWAGVAVASIEVVAGGALAAHAALLQRRQRVAELEAELLSVARQRDRATQSLAESNAAATLSDSASGSERWICDGCEAEFDNRFKFAGHRRHCETKGA